MKLVLRQIKIIHTRYKFGVKYNPTNALKDEKIHQSVLELNKNKMNFFRIKGTARQKFAMFFCFRLYLKHIF